MAKFRKKPVVIEAEQYLAPVAQQCDPLIDGVEYDGNGNPFIRTLEGMMNVSDGDWIITGIKGEKYPCKDEIFRMTYDPVEEG